MSIGRAGGKVVADLQETRNDITRKTTSLIIRGMIMIRYFNMRMNLWKSTMKHHHINLNKNHVSENLYTYICVLMIVNDFFYFLFELHVAKKKKKPRLM